MNINLESCLALGERSSFQQTVPGEWFNLAIPGLAQCSAQDDFSNSLLYEGLATLSAPGVGGLVSVEIFSMSGEPAFGPSSLSVHSTVRELLRMMIPPHGCSPVLLRRAAFHTSDGVLHNLEASLFSLIYGDVNTLQFNVVWQPWFQPGAAVSVVRSFRPRTRFGSTELEAGLLGKVVKIYRGSSAYKSTEGDEDWEEGDVLILFGERNLWVPRLQICSLSPEY